MAEMEWRLKYEGPATESGAMSVRELAPALLSFADFLHEANQIANPLDPDVTLNIRGTGQGSFLLDLLIANPEYVQSGRNLLSSQGATALANLFAITGGFVGFVAWLRHQRIVNSEPDTEPGRTRITREDGDSIVVDSPVVDLHRNRRARHDFRSFVEPVNQDGVDSVELDKGDDSAFVLGKMDLPSFDVESAEEAQTANSITRMALRIIQPDLEGNYSWRFTVGDRSSPIQARITDEGFLDRIQRGEQRFGHGDLLRCDVRFEQWTDTDGNMRSQYTVEKVDSHIESIGPQDYRLFQGDIINSPTGDPPLPPGDLHFP